MIKISADSTADLDYIADREKIPVIPLYVTLEGETYRDGVTISPQMIFDKYEQKKILPKTAAIGLEEYIKFFRDQTEGGHELLHFCISAELSASYNNARLAALEVPGVYVVDSRLLSTGIGLLVLKANDLKNEGRTAGEIFEIITNLAPCGQTSFVVQTMEFLHKGGRCSGLTKLLAGILKIRPVLQLIDGKIEVNRKFLGSYEKSVEKYVEATLRQYNTPDYTRIFVTHTFADPAIVEQVKAQIRELAPQFKEIIETKAGATVTSHCGKGTLGILYINKPLA